MPGGRETGEWIAESTPENSVFLTVGPSMANIVQFYGHRKAYGLSVSANPLHRNPSYEPVQNADLKIRSGEAQYLVFDVYSAARTSYFRDRMDHLVKKYKGRIVHVEYLPGTANGAENAANRIIII